MRIKGLEPPRREASDPKSDVATNYTISAESLAKIEKNRDIFENQPKNVAFISFWLRVGLFGFALFVVSSLRPGGCASVLRRAKGVGLALRR